jgi:hypothetical protein
MWNESFTEWRGGNIMLQMWQGYALNHMKTINGSSCHMVVPYQETNPGHLP